MAGLNVLEDFTYDVTKIEMTPGSIVVAASDNVLDIATPTGERFRPTWLAEFRRAGATTPATLGTAIVARVHELADTDSDRFELTTIVLGRL